ncbi:Cys-rich peptide radical SAM maturase CcpM [Clostridium sporogenes]|uniref:Cys-rich peptide radical SAM maturase CcpM n=1 Tax=Clostridium sporogenes TaxID=1509 RepID=UPI002237F8CD|nr:Cys-rich peptide radical SAM maturase CcpM [Clostridium sporogenes]MCW6060207.1 Cys-rich peptide radical SAM maturase CcpM [Clostridium sporogenes]MCW6068149.1 Cys-rich peptide radical SAM maturase CcpM [Clostridium sporogenes]
MNFQKPFVKLFETNKKYYLYDVNRNAILNISEDVYNVIKNVLNNQTIENINTYKNLHSIKKLQDEGFLSTNKIDKIEHSATELISYYLDNSIKMIILQVTQQCNFRCEYCVYSGGYNNRSHSNKKMSLETAKKGIDFLIRHTSNIDEIAIAFYGGEPLLEFDLIKKCIEYAEEKTEGKKVGFYVTINGSLLNNEIISYFNKHKVVLTISLDGPEEVQNSHRKFADGQRGTFEKVIKNVEYIVKNYPEYSERLYLNCVIDPTNNFTSIDEYFKNDKIVKDVNFGATLIVDTYSKNEIKESDDFYLKREYELFKIFTNVLRGNDLSKCSRIVSQEYSQIEMLKERLIPEKQLPKRTQHAGPCIPGQQRLFVNVDGDLYPCERVSEDSELMKIGTLDTGFDMDKVKNILNIGKLSEEQCKNCWAVRFCYICAPTIDDIKEFSPILKAQQCKMVTNSVEDEFKNYCVLREFGHDFQEKKVKANMLFDKCH